MEKVDMQQNQSKLVQLADLSWAIDGLTVYRNLRKDLLVNALHKVLCKLTDGEKKLADIYRAYHDFCALAIDKGWPDYLLNLILEDDNYFSRYAKQSGKDPLTSEVQRMIERELAVLGKLGRIKSAELIALAEELPYPEGLSLMWGSWDSEKVTLNKGDFKVEHKGNLWLKNKRQLVRAGLFKEVPAFADEDFHIKLLSDYYQQAGTGICGRYVAFRWHRPGEGLGGGLIGIEQPDIVDPSQLIGLEREMGIIYENTEHLLAGRTAHNMLLYGSRGTGKSSAVKSLLSKYAEQGLRMVELTKADLQDFQEIIEQLGDYHQKFILFIDDLSFEDMETEYKALKASLDGRLSVRPENVLIYATSNRRHLVRENFAERQGEDVHVQDNMNEKLSLADRFGLTVTFPATDQKRYLSIVEGLADQAGLHMDQAELRQMALRWEMSHNGRSGRTARQFIDYVTAKMNKEKKI